MNKFKISQDKIDSSPARFEEFHYVTELFQVISEIGHLEIELHTVKWKKNQKALRYLKWTYSNLFLI